MILATTRRKRLVLFPSDRHCYWVYKSRQSTLFTAYRVDFCCSFADIQSCCVPYQTVSWNVTSVDRFFPPLSLRHDAAKSTCLCSEAKTVFISVDNVHRLYPHNWHIIYSTYASMENVMQIHVLGRWTTAEKSSFLVYVGAKSIIICLLSVM